MREKAVTDQERLVALLDDFGIQHQAEPPDGPHDSVGPGGSEVVITSHGDKNDGYMFFYCTFQFGPDGAFEKVGVWE